MKLPLDLVGGLIVYSDAMVVEKLVSIVSNDFEDSDIWDVSLRLQGAVGASQFNINDYLVYNERYGCMFGDFPFIVNSVLTSSNYIWLLDSNGNVYSSALNDIKWVKSGILNRITRIRTHFNDTILAITELNEVFVLAYLNNYNRAVDFPLGAVDVYYDGTIKYVYPADEFLKVKNVAGPSGVQSIVISVGDVLDDILTSNGYYGDGYNPFSINIKTSKGIYRLREPKDYTPVSVPVITTKVDVKEEKVSVLGGYLQRNAIIDAYDNDLTDQIVSVYENNELFEGSPD